MIRNPHFLLSAALVIALTSRASAAEPASFAPIQTFLQTHCIECHGPKTSKGELVLHVYRDEASIVKGRKIWESVLERVEGGEMPPKKSKRPSDADVTNFVHAVHALFDRADATAKPDPGHVTIRRLNRAEYNNTIRDLMGMDLQPAEDFPSDDVGFGFDNIGDVLTISPVQMERYLAAAESVMKQAILTEIPKPTVRRQSARYLEPAGSKVPNLRFRPVTAGGVNTPYKLTIDGDYVLRSRVYAAPTGQSIEAAWVVDGKEVATFQVTATEKQPATVELPIKLQPGDHRFGLNIHLSPAQAAAKNEPELKPRAAGLDPAAAKPKADPDLNLDGPAKPKPKVAEGKPTLHVEFLELTGPADPRPISQRKLLAADPKLSQKEKTREVLTRFATQAYRRPVTRDEVARLEAVAEQVEARGDKWEAAIQLAMQAALASPKFLFRLELDDRPQSAEPHPLDEYQLASRLSYFLWSSMPDQELFDLAARKQLTANLDAQVKRMLKDPKSASLTENFAMQWLQLRRLRSFAPDTTLFPSFTERLRNSMLKETELFFNAVVQEDRSVLDLIDADYTFLNRDLAMHYGIADTAGNRLGQKKIREGGKAFDFGSMEFHRVPLPDRQRGGILTQASLLTVTSNPTRTSPVKRGRFVLDQILGTPPPPPPPDVPELKEDKKAALSGSLRQRMEQHRANPACANCHARMDPIGFAFENFNAIGQYRDKDGDFSIDPSGTLPDGKSFQGPAELKSILKEKKKLFARCLAQKLMTFALGRGVEYYDRQAVDKICNTLEKGDYKFSTLATAIATSDPFRLRRGKEQSP